MGNSQCKSYNLILMRDFTQIKVVLRILLDFNSIDCSTKLQPTAEFLSWTMVKVNQASNGLALNIF